MSRAPHLVLDGAFLAAAAVGADQVIVGVKIGAGHAREAIARALQERYETEPWTPRVRVVDVPPRYLAGEERALINLIDHGKAIPPSGTARPFEHGVGGRPTLVQNVETLAHLALIRQRGPDWFRELGQPDSPGTMLVSLGGTVSRPGIYEVPTGHRLADVLRARRRRHRGDRCGARRRVRGDVAHARTGGACDPRPPGDGRGRRHRRMRRGGRAAGLGVRDPRDGRRDAVARRPDGRAVRPVRPWPRRHRRCDRGTSAGSGGGRCPRPADALGGRRGGPGSLPLSRTERSGSCGARSGRSRPMRTRTGSADDAPAPRGRRSFRSPTSGGRHDRPVSHPRRPDRLHRSRHLCRAAPRHDPAG